MILGGNSGTPPLGSTVQQPEHAPAGSRSALLILGVKITVPVRPGLIRNKHVWKRSQLFKSFTSLSLPFVCHLQSALGPRSFFLNHITCLRVTTEAMPVYNAITIPQHGLLSCSSLGNRQKWFPAGTICRDNKLGLSQKGEISHFTAIQFNSENDVLKHGTIPWGTRGEGICNLQDQGGAFVHMWNRSWRAARLRLGPWIRIPWIPKISKVPPWTDYDGSTNYGFSGFRSGTEDGESRKVLEAAVWLSGGPSISGRDHTFWPLDDTENMGRGGRRWKMMIF